MVANTDGLATRSTTSGIHCSGRKPPVCCTRLGQRFYRQTSVTNTYMPRESCLSVAHDLARDSTDRPRLQTSTCQGKAGEQKRHLAHLVKLAQDYSYIPLSFLVLHVVNNESVLCLGKKVKK